MVINSSFFGRNVKKQSQSTGLSQAVSSKSAIKGLLGRLRARLDVKTRFSKAHQDTRCTFSGMSCPNIKKLNRVSDRARNGSDVTDNESNADSIRTKSVEEPSTKKYSTVTTFSENEIEVILNPESSQNSSSNENSERHRLQKNKDYFSSDHIGIDWCFTPNIDNLIDKASGFFDCSSVSPSTSVFEYLPLFSDNTETKPVFVHKYLSRKEKRTLLHIKRIHKKCGIKQKCLESIKEESIEEMANLTLHNLKQATYAGRIKPNEGSRTITSADPLKQELIAARHQLEVLSRVKPKERDDLLLLRLKLAISKGEHTLGKRLLANSKIAIKEKMEALSENSVESIETREAIKQLKASLIAAHYLRNDLLKTKQSVKQQVPIDLLEESIASAEYALEQCEVARRVIKSLNRNMKQIVHLFDRCDKSEYSHRVIEQRFSKLLSKCEVLVGLHRQGNPFIDFRKIPNNLRLEYSNAKRAIQSYNRELERLNYLCENDSTKSQDLLKAYKRLSEKRKGLNNLKRDGNLFLASYEPSAIRYGGM